MTGVRLSFRKSGITNLHKRLILDDRFRKIFTVFVWSCFIFLVLGWNLGQGGPTLLDLQIVSNCTLEEASLFFTAIACGYLLSSFVIAVTFDRFNKFLYIIFGNIGVSVVMAAIPWCVYYELMFAMHLLKGFMCGVADAVISTYLIRLLGQDCRSYMQIIHFFFTVGGILSPLASSPFLTLNEMQHPLTNRSFHNTTAELINLEYTTDAKQLPITDVTLILNTTDQPLSTEVYKAYSISSGLSLVSTVPFIFMYFRYKNRLTISNSKKSDNMEVSDSLPKHIRIPALLLIALSSFVYTAMEDSFAAFLATFVVKHFKWDKVIASYATSVYWGSFAGGSFIGILIAPFFKLSRFLCVYSFMIVISFTCLLVASLYNISFGIWISATMCGIFMSVFFPLFFVWTEKDFFNVSARITALIMVSGSSGVIVNPILLGQMMKRSSIWFCYILLGESIFLFWLLLVGILLSKKTQMIRRQFKQEINIKINDVINDEIGLKKQNSQIVEITRF